MPISYSNGEAGGAVRAKINGIFGVDGGAMTAPYELTFDVYHRIRTLTVNSDIEIGIASSGLVSNTFETLVTTGDGDHDLTFEPDILLQGDTWNKNKVQCIDFRCIAGAVLGIITTISDSPDITAPTLVSATVENTAKDKLVLVFDEAVTIASAFSGSGTTTVTLDLSRDIVFSETMTVSYAAGAWTIDTDGSSVTVTGGACADLEGNALATIVDDAITNNVVDEQILLSDDLNNSSIDGSLWTTVNPADGVAIAETTTLNFTSNPASAVASANTNYVASTNGFAVSKAVLRATVTRNSNSVNQTIVLRMYNGGDTFATARQAQMSKTAAGKFLCRVYNGTTFVHDETTTTDWTTSATPIRIIKEATQIRFQVWNGSSWTTISTYSGSMDFGSVKVSMHANSNGSDSGSPTFSVGTLRLTNYEFAGSTP